MADRKEEDEIKNDVKRNGKSQDFALAQAIGIARPSRAENG